MIKENGIYIDLDEMNLTINNYVYDKNILQTINSYYPQMTTANYIMDTFGEEYELSKDAAWYVAGKICRDMDKYDMTMAGAINTGLTEYIESFREDIIQPLIEAGDWHIDLEKIKALSGHDYFTVADVCTVNFGNRQFIIEADSPLEGKLKSYDLYYSMYRPVSDFNTTPTSKVALDFDPLEWCKMKKFSSVLTYLDLDKYVEKCPLKDGAMIKRISSEYIFDDINSLKEVIVKKLLQDEQISSSFIKEYSDLKKHGFFQQLEKTLDDYQCQLAFKDKLSVHDIKSLVSFYSPKEPKVIVDSLVKKGFHNEQINLVCNAINKLDDIDYIPRNLYSGNTLNSRRKELLYEVKSFERGVNNYV